MFKKSMKNSFLISKLYLMLFLASSVFSAPCQADEPADESTLPQTVAVIEVETPATLNFTVRATVPLPQGIFPRDDGQNPFGIRRIGSDEIRPAQANAVKWYADADQHKASVVEISAAVDRDPSSPSRIQYEIVYPFLHNQATITNPYVRWGRRVIYNTSNLPVTIRRLIASPVPINLTATGPFEDKYSLNLLESSAKIIKYGPNQRTVRFAGSLEYIPGTGSSPIPHSLGIIAYLTTMSHTNALIVDLRIHNSHAGEVPENVHIGTQWFKELVIDVPSSYKVDSLVRDRQSDYVGEISPSGRRRVFKIITPMADNKLHFMKSQTTLLRRLVVYPVGEDAAGQRALLRKDGQGFVVAGFNNLTNEKYWSWWNEQTANYQEGVELPNLDNPPYSSKDQIRSVLNGKFGYWRNLMTAGEATINGSGNPTLPFMEDQHGPYLFWGTFADMSLNWPGGTEIRPTAESRTAFAGSVEGLLYNMLFMMTLEPRQTNSLYKKNGEPWQHHESLIPCGNASQGLSQPYAFQSPDSRPYLDQGNPWGLGNNFPVHNNAGENLNRTPNYYSYFFGNGWSTYQPFNWSHFIRILAKYMVLSDLMNDTMALDQINMWGNLAMATYTQYPKYNGPGAYCHDPYGSLLSSRHAINNSMHTGGPFGREWGWRTLTGVMAYSYGNTSYRLASKSWIDANVELIRDAQIPCSGFYLKKWLPDQFPTAGDNYTRQVFEQTFGEHALNAANNLVYKDFDEERQEMTEHVLLESLKTHITIPYYGTLQHEPAKVAIVADASGAPYCPDTTPASLQIFSCGNCETGWAMSRGYELAVKAGNAQLARSFIDHAIDMVGAENEDDALDRVKQRFGCGWPWNNTEQTCEDPHYTPLLTTLEKLYDNSGPGSGSGGSGSN